MTIDQPVRIKLRPLCIQDITKLATIEFDLDLLLRVKVVEPRRERVVEAVHVAGGMQRVPRANAGLLLARL